MYELSDFGLRQDIDQFRRAVLVGEAIRFRRTDLGSLAVTITRQPTGGIIELLQDGSDWTTPAFILPGVYRFELLADNFARSAAVYCWPASVVAIPTFAFDNGQRPRPTLERDALARRVLHSIAHGATLTAADSLFLANGHFPAALVGGSAENGLSLSLHGA